MIGISAPAPTTPTRSAPRVVHGLAYGVLASVMMWTAIGAVVYNLI
ncbi:hypothetical protein [Sphingomonas faeni]|nr:hypothetical protein [Sphingomonas faeni]MCP8892409.1 hypothetical protein [Sphingomonas faeni]